MHSRPWAVATTVAALLAATAARAGADTPPAGPEPIPTATPTPTATPAPLPGLPGLPDTAGSVIYVVTVTTTITTTNVTAPITVVAAPITTTTTNTTNTSTAASNTSTSPAAGVSPVSSVKATREGSRARLEISLHGCTSAGRRSASLTRASLRLPRGTTLVVRVNDRSVGTLDLSGDRGPKARPLPLRIELGKDGLLTVHRPSGRVLTIQGCSAR